MTHNTESWKDKNISLSCTCKTSPFKEGFFQRNSLLRCGARKASHSSRSDKFRKGAVWDSRAIGTFRDWFYIWTLCFSTKMGLYLQPSRNILSFALKATPKDLLLRSLFFEVSYRKMFLKEHFKNIVFKLFLRHSPLLWRIMTNNHDEKRELGRNIVLRAVSEEP